MVEEIDFKFDDKLRHQIHFDWGKFFFKRSGKNESAKKQFLDSLSLKENALGPMEQLSKCYLVRGDAPKALEYANQCIKNHPKVAREKYHRNECIYDCNEFETCLLERYRMLIENKSSLGAVDAIKMTELTLEESIGTQTGSFLDNFRSAISELDKIKADVVDDRPVWKIRREKGECDVVSICSDSNKLTEFKTIDHPLELCRFRKRQKSFRSMYFSTPTIDTFNFLENLTNDPRLHLPPCEESTQTIRNSAEEELEVFKKFETMLRHRQPMYAKRILQNNINNKKFNAMALSRLKETIETRAKSQIERIQKMRCMGNFSGLLTFVEDIMTNFYLIKSVKVFPKKCEYMEIIYNIVGTCYIDKVEIPTKDTPDNPHALFDSALSYRHTFATPKKFNIMPSSKNANNHFLRRLQYTDVPIEKCYIYHQLSRLYFEQEKYTESKEMGEELIKISSMLNNYTWMLLGHLRVMLVDASLGELDNLKRNVEAVRAWKNEVNQSIWTFLERIISIKV